MRASRYLSDYLKAEMVKESGPQRLTITDYEEVELKNQKGGGTERKLAIVLDSGQKLVLNVTNNRTLIDAFGDETDDWIGQVIEVYFDPDVTFGGKRAGGLRIRIPAPDEGPVKVAS